MTTSLWVVTLDGTHARFFERLAPGGRLNELQELALEAPEPPRVRDRPSRVHDRIGPGRHVIEGRLTPALAREHAFMDRVVDMLDRALVEGCFQSLIISAPPRAVGYLRQHLSDAVMSRVKDIWAKDLTKAKVEEIDDRLGMVSGN
jgi:protein required for attachment to host cells